MIVISLTNSPAQLRGYLTRYLSEIQSGLFIGCCSARVRDALWETIKISLTENNKAILAYNDGTEQGYHIEYYNYSNRDVYYIDGLEIPMTSPGITLQSDNKHWSKAYWRSHK